VIRKPLCTCKSAKKTDSKLWQNECTALPVTTIFGSETKKCVTEFYVRRFPTYSTKKHPSYEVAHELSFHPIA
jgi:hypothetical protein